MKRSVLIHTLCIAGATAASCVLDDRYHPSNFLQSIIAFTGMDPTDGFGEFRR